MNDTLSLKGDFTMIHFLALDIRTQFADVVHF